MQTVNLLGAGLMGMGIAQYLSQQGMSVTVRDVDQPTLEKGLERTRQNLKGQVERGRMTQQDMDKTLANIKTTTKMEGIAQADLVIEAIFEDMEVKKKVFAELDALCPPRTILATNTSILSPTEIGSATKRPPQTIGMHWFNPAPVMKLIEVTAGLETSEDTLQAVMDFARKVGKTPVRVNEAPGGITSRILCAMRNAAVDILAEGVASAEDIDTAMKLGANFPMGPLELIDLVGVDIATINSDNLYKEIGHDKYRPNALLRKMVRAGHLGRKSGRGFYSYK
ncbi:MAG: 3-hydroxybutyryl-CoA dehydrogenase [Chloroflexi bacterium]|nr:3-hydroxybutyryl-CoA dehydrogenase [Chloroflexota bacterium]